MAETSKSGSSSGSSSSSGSGSKPEPSAAKAQSTEEILERAKQDEAALEAGREESAKRLEATGPPDEQPAGHPKDPTTG